MKTLFKIILITIFALFIGVKGFHTYQQIKVWLNEPTQEEINYQYQKRNF